MFDSITPLSTSTGGIIDTTNNSVRNGNVTLVGDSTVTVSGVSMNNNLVSYSFTVKAADGAEDVTYDVDVYVNGRNVWTRDDVSYTTNRSGMVSGNVTVAASEVDTVRVEVSNASVETEEPVVPSNTQVKIDGFNIVTAEEGSDSIEQVADAIVAALNAKGYIDVKYSMAGGTISAIEATRNGGKADFTYMDGKYAPALEDGEKATVVYLEEGESIADAVSKGAETIYLTDGEFKMSSKVEGDLTIIGDEDTVIVSTSENTAEDAGLYVTTGDLVVENITFTGIGNGIVTAPDFTGTVTIRNCTFDGVNNGIYLNNCAGGLISGCVFKDVKHAAIGIDTLTGTLTLSNKDYGTAGEIGGDIEAFNGSEGKLEIKDGAKVIDADAE